MLNTASTTFPSSLANISDAGTVLQTMAAEIVVQALESGGGDQTIKPAVSMS
jgi:hypothetical protein